MPNIAIYATQEGKSKLEVLLEDETIWLNQKQIAELYGKSKKTISEHINNIFNEEELDRNSVVRYFRTTADDGKRYDVAYYNLDMIIAIGFRVRSRAGTQFRRWANDTLREYLVKGFVMDDERLKNPPVGESRAPDYFDEMLERIRDIRASGGVCISECGRSSPWRRTTTPHGKRRRSFSKRYKTNSTMLLPT